MTTTITNLSDLRTWVAERVTAETTDIDRAAIVDAIRHNLKRPAWGLDWSEYLAALPENLNDLIATG